MRVGALLNTTVRIKRQCHADGTLYPVHVLIKYVAAIMGPDKEWILAVYSSGRDKSEKDLIWEDFIWDLCKVLILKYSYSIKDCDFKTKLQKMSFFGYYKETLECCKSAMRLKKQRDDHFGTGNLFTVSNISEILNPILEELMQVTN
ncbi:MAG TPA: hypothetical protein ENI23_13795 [bacterium]|nr:hypothetical protein [bacterium]